MADDMLMAIGANLTSSIGAPKDTIIAAFSKLTNFGAVIRSQSHLYNTPAFPEGNGPNFVNAAAKISANWTPEQALEIFHDIEVSFGRRRDTRWGQRTLDLDLIACGDLVLPDAQTHMHWRTLDLDDQMAQTPDGLILPHPRMQDRAFVLVPLADVAPDWVHPLLGTSVLDMRDALDAGATEEVRRIEYPLVNQGEES